MATANGTDRTDRTGAAGAAVGPGPRERLLAAAQELTYRHGMGVGVDALLKGANVARRSLYEHFGGKDGLIVEVLRRSTAEDAADYRRTLGAAGDDPRTRLLAVFDRLAVVVAAPGFRGCRYLAADLALTDPEHPGHEVTRRYREQVAALLADELRALGHPRPDRAAAQLLLLIDGAMAAAATRPGTEPVAVAREMAERVLAESVPPEAVPAESAPAESAPAEGE
ncbi:MULTISPECIES: TetR/AcrR family transcriptional regulator [Kitasatospora]|uniref:Putative TetR family transcriptional regulator n=1 Tax=Kitasatospora setae (strain ATCC 33774 / DSM 43861 / JCM 3304 / KCC A-0304 / NBRC 14216 / KM-6054) TaxID=452652 RepID=E4NIZ2_KITSK|nr:MULTISPECIES: TetR/AcrR family transcriptional regulator [Kitasatospora]BAJ32940.1 putative TetR family transcriptional regulator [Kitasatospora setae KM-6054]